MSVHCKLFLVILLDFLLYYHAVTHWPLTLIKFTAVHTHTMNICAKFHWNPSTKYRAIVQCKTGFNKQWTASQTTQKHDVLHHWRSLQPAHSRLSKDNWKLFFSRTHFLSFSFILIVHHVLKAFSLNATLIIIIIIITIRRLCVTIFIDIKAIFTKSK